jgi:hypothetical protein
MKILTIELLNDKAETLLEDLEALNLIKIVENSIPKKLQKKPSDYFGIITEEEGNQILNYVNESRAEWDRDI